MCLRVYLKILQINRDHVTLEDGRIARLAPIGEVKIGDTVEVYADLVIGKASDQNAIIRPSKKLSTFH